jgi:hypothetical protein
MPMAPRRTAKRRQAAQTKIEAGSAATGETGSTGSTRSWSGFIFDALLGKLVGRAMRFYAGIWLGIGGMLLTIAWQAGPQRAIEAHQFSKLVSRVDSRIVESWLALEWYPADMGDNLRWRAFTKAAPCVVVEYEAGGDWGAALRRAFCGNRFQFTESYTLHDVDRIAPGVPFAWMHDASGFAVPEIRLSHAALEWLAGHPPADPVLANHPPGTALDQLQRETERPVDYAVGGWAASATGFALAIDPRNPAGAMPADFVDERRHDTGNWLLFAMFAFGGLLFWHGGMRLLLGDIGPAALWLATLLPMLALPWWSESLPRGLRAINVEFAGVVGDMLDTLDPLGRLIASEPAAAAQAGGARLAWPAGKGLYAETFGKLRFARPDPPPSSADAALAALAESARAQVRAMPAAEQAALFSRLAADKAGELPHAGLIFLLAARETLLDARGDEAARATARGFLADWVTQPVVEPYPGDAGFGQRVQLFRELTDLSVPVIANPAGWIVERAQKAR